MSQALTPSIPEAAPAKTPFQAVSEGSVQNAWVTEANDAAVRIGRESTMQEGLRTNMDMLASRLDKLQPSSRVLEKSLNVLKRQAAKEDRVAGWKELWQQMAEKKAGRLTEKSVSQAEKANKLQRQIDRRISVKDVIQNANQFAAQEAQRMADEYGVKVDIAAKDKDGNAFTRWFDRNVLNKIDEMRKGHNEKLAVWNSKRAEGQIQNAIGYQEAAQTLRQTANELRAKIETSRQKFAESVNTRRRQLEEQQSSQSEALTSSSDRAADAARRLNIARGDVQGMGVKTGAEMAGLSNDAMAAKTNEFVASAAEALNGPTTNGTQ